MAASFLSSSHGPILRRSFAATLILCLVVVPVQSTLAASSQALWDNKTAWWAIVDPLLRFFPQQGNGMPPRPALPQPQEPKPPASKEEKEAKVAAIQINLSSESWIPSKQRFTVTGVPLDKDGNALHGLPVQWTTSDKQTVFVTKDGRAVAGRPGTAKLTGRAGNKQETIKFNIYEAGRVLPQTTSGRSKAASKTIAAAQRRQFAHAPLLEGIDDRLPDAETSTLYQPRNDVGKPEGRTEASAQTSSSANSATETPGSGNYSFSVALAGLPGRQRIRRAWRAHANQLRHFESRQDCFLFRRVITNARRDLHVW